MTQENVSKLKEEEFAGSGLIMPVKRHCPEPIRAHDIKAKQEADAKKEKAAEVKAEKEKLAT